MARIRSVHPSLFTDEAWVSCSPLARILYIGLWTDADDQGLFEWKPLQLKMRLLPGDGADAGALLGELASVDLIKPYDHDGRRFGAIKDFRKFQRPQKPNAIHPITEAVREYVSLPTPISDADPEPVSDQSATDPVIPPQMEDGGGRGRGEETEETIVPSVPPPKAAGAVKRGSRIPDDWTPTPNDTAFAAAEGLTPEETARAAADFRDFWSARSGREATKLDWPATWRQRVRSIADRKRPAGQAGGAKAGGHRPQPASMAGILAERRRQAPFPDDVSDEGRILRTG